MPVSVILFPFLQVFPCQVLAADCILGALKERYIWCIYIFMVHVLDKKMGLIWTTSILGEAERGLLALFVLDIDLYVASNQLHCL